MKNNKFILGFVLMFIISFNYSIAVEKNITLSANQSDYYFLLNQNAIIPITVNNTYGNTTGMLTYSITTKINQGNFYYSSSNTQSQNMNLQEGNYILNMNFGTSNKEETLNVKLSYQYDNKIISLNNINIHFVENNNQKNNTANQVKSQESSSNNNNNNNNNQNINDQLQKELQKLMNQNQEQQSNTQNNIQKKLQNNQISQDSAALKKQMEQQIRNEQKLKNNFQKNLAKNDDFLKKNSELNKEGYNISNVNVEPKNNNTGNFTLTYKNQEGKTKILSGTMINNTIKKLTEKKVIEDKDLIKILFENKKFQELNNSLYNEHYNITKVYTEKNNNKTYVYVDYKQNSKNAEIKAEFNDENIKSIKLIKDSHNKIIILLLIAMILSYTILKIAKKYIKKEETKPEKISKKISIDYRKEALKFLEKAIEIYNKDFKKAYELLSKAINYYLINKYNFDKDLTNRKIIQLLPKNKRDDLKEIIENIELVEFAKFKPNKKEFLQFIEIIKKYLNEN